MNFINSNKIWYLPSHSSNPKWISIKRVLENVQPPITTELLETSIRKYFNFQHSFECLHSCVNQLDSEYRNDLYYKTFPFIISLVLKENSPKEYKFLGDLTNHKNGEEKSSCSVEMTSEEASILVAHSFLCTFPPTNSLYRSHNCDGLFKAQAKVKCVENKIKCLLHYFTKVSSPSFDKKRKLKYSRVCLKGLNGNEWAKTRDPLCPLSVQTEGSIHDSHNFLQVDFANKNIGGGVFKTGAVQEEIRFITCPEMLVSCFLSEKMKDSEAILIEGYKQFSKYSGYGKSFCFDGDFQDPTTRDNDGNILSETVAIDAIRFSKKAIQFKKEYILRELNKAYVGFYDYKSGGLPIATGNWGCGAFCGNPKLKSLIQIIAASKACRSMVYYTFNNEEIKDLSEIHSFLQSHSCTTGKLFSILTEFNINLQCDLFSFIKTKFS